MKQGLSLQDLATKIMADRERKHDVIVDTRKMTVLASEEGGATLTLPEDHGLGELDMLNHVHRQVGQHLKVRADFYDRLRTGHPGLYTHLINGLLRESSPGPRMIRAYKGEDGQPGVARAFLGNGYRRIDHDMIVEHAIPVLQELPDAQVLSADVTDTKLYLKVVVPTVSYDLAEFIEPGKHVFLPDGGDVVQAGVVIKNSEVGVGGFDVEQMVYRLVCKNGLITGSVLRRRHVGKRVEEGTDLMGVYADDTRRADDRALMLKLRDEVKAAVDDTRFRAICQEFAAAKDSTPIEQPIKAMEVLAQQVRLTDGERNSVLEHLIKDGDYTKFGAVNAVTRASQDVQSYDRATELEELGADVMRMSAKDWDAIATAA